MSLALVRFVYREAKGPKLAVMGSSLASGLSRGLLLATINTAAGAAAPGRSNLVYVAAFLALLLVYLGTEYFALSRAQILVQGMIQRLRLRICEKLLYTELRFVEARGKGELYARLTQEINHVSNSAVTLLNAFQAAVLLTFSLAYMGWLAPLGLLATAIIIIAGVTTYQIQSRRAAENLRRARAKEVEFFNSISDQLEGFKEIKINRARRNDISDYVTGISDAYRGLNVRTAIMFLRSYLTTQSYMFILIGLVVFALPQLMTQSTTTIFQFLAAILFVVGPLEVVVSSIPSITGARVALENVERLEKAIDDSIDELENRADRVEPLPFETIELRGLGFEYRNTESDDHFRVGPIDLDIHRGEILFVTGGNGSGKTTLLKLLTGLYFPMSGCIRVDGRELPVHDYQAYREMFTTIFSDFHLFPRLYGIRDVDGAELDALLDRMELRSKTHYDEGRFTSVNLSTGQRKRLAYIITQLERRQIHLFDELAADQDPAFRRFFYRTLLQELKARGKTVIAVTHDDNYFDACDRLVKMDYGRIVAETEAGPAEAGTAVTGDAARP